MKLSQIRLAGFKSFVEPITIELPSSLCAIVGPNGCGKSNVMEAVRWVLGESAARGLRGESGTDVIFNGTDRRKPLSQCSVELIFDNSEGRLGGQFGAFSEVAVRRRILTDGTSEYSLNGTRCRRRDVLDTFIGTGLGPRNYALIEQNLTHRLIVSRPDELRAYIEEAAGVSLYRERLRETGRSIQRTRENLARLNDLMEELHRRMERLQRQARAAKRYERLVQERGTLRAQLRAMRWRVLSQAVAGYEQEIVGIASQLEQQDASRLGLQAQIDAALAHQHECLERLRQTQQTEAQSAAEVQGLQQRVALLQQRQQQLQVQLGEIEGRLERLQASLQQAGSDATEGRAVLESAAAQLQQLQAHLAESRGRVDTLGAERAVLEVDWQQCNEQMQGLRGSLGLDSAALVHRQEALARAQEQLQMLQQSADRASDGSLSADLARATSLCERLHKRRAKLEFERDEALVAVERTDGLISALRQEVEQLRGRIASLEQLQAEVHTTEGSEDEIGTAAHWLREAPALMRLVEMMQIQPGWELAVEVALGDWLKAVCLDDSDLLHSALQEIEQGQLQLLYGGGVADAMPGTLAEQVDAPGAIVAMLSHVHCVDSADEARERVLRLSMGESVVTRDGRLFGPGWVRIGSPLLTDSVLEQSSRLRTCREQLEGVQAQLTARLDERGAAVEQRNSTEQGLQEVRRELSQADASRVAAETELRSLQAQNRQHAEQIHALQTGSEQDREQQQRLELAVADHQQQCDTLAPRLHELTGQRDAVVEELAGLTEAYNSRTEAEREQALAVSRAHHRIQLSQDRAEAAESQLQQQRGFRQTGAAEQAALKGQTTVLQEHLQGLLTRNLETTRAAEQAREAYDDAQHRHRTLAESLKGTEAERERLQEQSVELIGQQQRGRGEADALLHEINDEGFVLDALLSDLPEHLDEEQWRADLEVLNNKIKRIGPVNLAAAEEYQEEQARQTSTEDQVEEVQRALASLEGVSKRIEEQAREQFQQSFDSINKALGEKFALLFNGGSAALELDSEKTLEGGVSIRVQPPGKRRTSVGLLSGGERALTSIALVLSLFELNPAPFCMMDEVDASLDESNAGRFAELITAMLDQIQFVLITHNRVVMERAQILLGVTMQEPGVSRLVSVDVDEAVRLSGD